MQAQTVLDFWFGELRPAQWWRVDPALDSTMRSRYGALHAAACAGELYTWRGSDAGRLAEVIVLDQFSRNLHRGSARAFAADPMALALAQEAVAAGVDTRLPDAQRAFLYMPYMHSESRLIHQVAERLFSAEALAGNRASARSHKAIIDRYGRYPHRNAVLGRLSTPDEVAFLKQPGSGF